MIEPKDGEWWMCDRNGVEVPFYNDDGRWCESECDREYNYSDAKPLYRMVKAEEPKLRTKTVYEKVDDLIFNLKDDLDNGRLYGINDDDTYWKIATTHTLAGVYKDRELYRKVEKEIDWESVLDDFGGRTDGLTVHVSNTWSRDALIQFCHEIAELTDKPE